MADEEVEISGDEIQAYRETKIVNDWIWGPRPMLAWDEARRQLIARKQNATKEVEMPKCLWDLD